MKKEWLKQGVIQNQKWNYSNFPNLKILSCPLLFSKTIMVSSVLEKRVWCIYCYADLFGSSWGTGQGWMDLCAYVARWKRYLRREMMGHGGKAGREPWVGYANFCKNTVLTFSLPFNCSSNTSVMAGNQKTLPGCHYLDHHQAKSAPPYGSRWNGQTWL